MLYSIQKLDKGHSVACHAAQTRSRSAGWGVVFKPMSRFLYAQKDMRYKLYRKLVETQGQSCKELRRENLMLPLYIESDLPTCIKLLHQLCYPGTYWGIPRSNFAQEMWCISPDNFLMFLRLPIRIVSWKPSTCF